MPSPENFKVIDKNREFSFNKEDLQAYAKKEGWDLDFEKIDWEHLNPELDEEHSLQLTTLVAHLRSKKYPEVTATSSLKKSRIEEIQIKEPDKDIHEEVYSWLCSNGHAQLEKKELPVMGELEKEKFTKDSSDLLEKEHVTIQAIEPSRRNGEVYSYYAGVRSTDDRVLGKANGESVDEAVKGAIKNLREQQALRK